MVLEKDAQNFLERTPYLERELMGKVARMKLQYFGVWTRYQGKCRKFGTDSLGLSVPN